MRGKDGGEPASSRSHKANDRRLDEDGWEREGKEELA